MHHSVTELLEFFAHVVEGRQVLLFIFVALQSQTWLRIDDHGVHSVVGTSALGHWHGTPLLDLKLLAKML